LADGNAANWAWLSAETIGDMLAVAQSLPGAIGVNLAAYTGFSYAAANGFAGVSGGVLAALGLVTPSIIIIVLVARALEAFKENRVVKGLFSGFRPAAAGLLSAAGFAAITLSLWNSAASQWFEMLRWKETLIFIILFVFIHKFKLHPIVYIIAAGLLGALLAL
jgi:chromate transporter